VDRLARTFRETLRALEESLTGQRPQAAPEDADRAASPAAEPAPPPAEPARDERSPFLEPDRELLQPAPQAARPEAPPSAIPAIRADVAPPLAESAPVEAIVTESPAPSVVEPRPVAPPRPISSPAPDVLRNIEEAALIRQRLPQHVDMLLRIPTNEVAQNSYKSPFRETREELIRRLLDPQLTLEEAARVLGVCPTTVRRYTNRGMLHCHRTPGNQRRFRMSDVLQFVEQYADRIDRAAEARQFEEAA
jgi:excisionase family DNA binding protein